MAIWLLIVIPLGILIGTIYMASVVANASG